MDDTDAVDKKFQKELNSGTISLVLLSIMSKASEPMYGYEIALMFKNGDEEQPGIKQGVLYPVLRSLQGNNLLESYVEPSVSGPPRRYYRITESGQAALERWQTIWRQMKDFVDKFLEGDQNE